MWGPFHRTPRSAAVTASSHFPQQHDEGAAGIPAPLGRTLRCGDVESFSARVHTHTHTHTLHNHIRQTAPGRAKGTEMSNVDTSVREFASSLVYFRGRFQDGCAQGYPNHTDTGKACKVPADASVLAPAPGASSRISEHLGSSPGTGLCRFCASAGSFSLISCQLQCHFLKERCPLSTCPHHRKQPLPMALVVLQSCLCSQLAIVTNLKWSCLFTC